MKLLAGLLAVVSLCAAADKDMQRAIAWERQKDRAAARQARLEKRHPSVPAVATTTTPRIGRRKAAGQHG